MAEYLKAGRSGADIAADDAQTRSIVEAALDDIARRGDVAVREMSIKFDGLDREDFRLSDQEIERCLSTLSKRDLDDIRFAQAQVRNFAEHQRASMKDVEVETLPGVGLALRSKFKTGPTRHRGITGFRTA